MSQPRNYENGAARGRGQQFRGQSSNSSGGRLGRGSAPPTRGGTGKSSSYGRGGEGNGLNPTQDRTLAGPGIPQQHYNPQIAHPGYPAMQAHSGVNGVGRGYTHVGPQGSSPGHAAAGNDPTQILFGSMVAPDGHNVGMPKAHMITPPETQREAQYNASPITFGTLDVNEAVPDSNGPQGSPLVQGKVGKLHRPGGNQRAISSQGMPIAYANGPQPMFGSSQAQVQSAAPHAHPNMQSPGVHQLPIPMHAAMPMQMANPGVQQPQPSPSHPSRQLYGQSNMVYAGPAVYVQPVVTPQPMYGQQPQTFQNWSPQLQQYGGPMPPGPIPSRPPGPVPPQQRQSRALKITDPQTGEELKLGKPANHASLPDRQPNSQEPGPNPPTAAPGQASNLVPSVVPPHRQQRTQSPGIRASVPPMGEPHVQPRPQMPQVQPLAPFIHSHPPVFGTYSENSLSPGPADPTKGASARKAQPVIIQTVPGAPPSEGILNKALHPSTVIPAEPQVHAQQGPNRGYRGQPQSGGQHVIPNRAEQSQRGPPGLKAPAVPRQQGSGGRPGQQGPRVAHDGSTGQAAWNPRAVPKGPPPGLSDPPPITDKFDGSRKGMDDSKKPLDGQQHKRDENLKEKKKSVEADAVRKPEGIADGRKGVDTAVAHAGKMVDKSAADHTESASSTSPRNKTDPVAKPADGSAGGPKDQPSNKVLPLGGANRKAADTAAPVEEEAPLQVSAAGQKGTVASADTKAEKGDNKKGKEKEEGIRDAEEADARWSKGAEAESSPKEVQAQQAVGAAEPAEQGQVTEGVEETAHENITDAETKQPSGGAEPPASARNREDDEATGKTEENEATEPTQRAEEEVGPAGAAEEEAAAAASVSQAEAEGALQKKKGEETDGKGELAQSDASSNEGFKKGAQAQKDGAQQRAKVPGAADPRPADLSGQSKPSEGADIPVVAKDDTALLATAAPGDGVAVEAHEAEPAIVNSEVGRSELPGSSPPASETEPQPKLATEEGVQGVEVGRVELESDSSALEVVGAAGNSDPSSHPIALDVEEPEEAAAPAVATAAVPAVSSKVKRKQALAKAEERPAQGDLLDAFTDHPKAQVPATPATPPPAPQISKATSSRAQGPKKPEASVEDDWETAALPSPDANLLERPSLRGLKVSTSGKITYTKDFLLTLRDSCKDRPPGLENNGLRELEITGNQGAPGRGPSGFERPAPRGAALQTARSAASEDYWGSKRAPPPGAQSQGMMRDVRPARSGPPPRSGMEGDQWKRATPLPPPPGMPSGPKATTLHRTADRFVAGKVQGDDPEEAKKQKEIKGLLNKITPEKYETIKEQILQVPFTERTLRGLIDQVFDKALGEPTFCEIYAQLCQDLSKRIPTFPAVPANEETGEPGREEVSFRRELLNKCQVEFEEGQTAMDAVMRREKAEAEAKSKEDPEEGEITTEDAKAKKLQELKAAAAELKARHRALGNIQFIGQLFKHAMLIEKIMHECLQQLLFEAENPKQEDVECLCKLLTTVGQQIDANPKATPRMDAYFGRITRMSVNKNLEARLRFMLQDVIELRTSKWQVRRKVEGPKTIKEIHDEAKEEALRAAARAAAPDRRDRDGRRGFTDQRMPMRSGPRYETTVLEPIRPMAARAGTELTLRPGGGSSTSLRPGGDAAMRPMQVSLRPQGRAPTPPKETASSSNGAIAPISSISESEIGQNVENLIREFFSLRDFQEVDSRLGELVSQHADFSVVVSKLFQATITTKGFDDAKAEAFVGLMNHIATSDSLLVAHDGLAKGLLSVISEGLEGFMDDNPRYACPLVGKVIASWIKLKLLTLDQVIKRTQEACSSSGQDDEVELRESGGALTLICCTLEEMAKLSDPEEVSKAWKAGGYSFEAFVPQIDDPGASEKILEDALKKHGLQTLQLM